MIIGSTMDKGSTKTQGALAEQKPGMDKTTDDLGALLVGVDTTSIHLVYDRTAAVLYGAALRMTGNEEQACTILRNVFNTIRMPGNGYTTDQGRPLLWLLRQVHAAGSALLKRSGVRAEGTTLPTSPVDQTLYLSLRCYALSTGTMEDHKPGDRVIGRHEVLNHLRRNMPR